MGKKLSIIIPCYNEEEYVEKVLRRVMEVSLDYNLAKEIIIVNDGSTDLTQQKINGFISDHPGTIIKSIQHQKNYGKGSCIKSALTEVTGDIIVIQDADQEYAPSEYNKLIKPILEGYADVVYGSRFRGSEAHRVLFFFHTIGNKLLTFLSNLFTGLNLTDMETGYKTFKTDILKGIHLKENRFGFEPEVTARISRIKKIRIYEVGISYYGRGFDEGKKIRWHDGVWAIYCIFKYNIFSRKQSSIGPTR